MDYRKVAIVKRYIQNQKAHQAKNGFKKEFIRFL
jgi:hypothetical protein